MNNGGWGTSRVRGISACHPERPHYAKGLCRLCYRNTPAMQQIRRAYYQAHKPRWVGYGENQTQRRTKQVKAYGVSAEALREMLADQRGLCALCGNPPKRKALALDHCHKTKRVRAFLCHSCNNALGLLKDDPNLCDRAAAYLRRHSL